MSMQPAKRTFETTQPAKPAVKGVTPLATILGLKRINTLKALQAQPRFFGAS